MFLLFAVGGCGSLVLNVGSELSGGSRPADLGRCETGIYSFDEAVVTDSCGVLPEAWFTDESELRCVDDAHFQWTVADSWFDCTLDEAHFVCAYTYEEALHDGTGRVNRYEEALEGEWVVGEGPRGTWRSETFYLGLGAVGGCLRLSEFESTRQ